jgi:alcohol dehydrogenase
MKALVYHGPGKRIFEDRPRPAITAPTDAIVRVTNASICGADLRAMWGGSPPVVRGLILGHEGTGIVEKVGDSVCNFRVGDCVLISCLTWCGTCAHCENGEHARCENGGRILGSAIDGTCAEYVRVPFADRGLFSVPGAGDDNTDGPWIDDHFPGGFMRDVFEGPDEHTNTAPIVVGGSVGMGPVLAVLEYYRTVLHPILGTDSHRRL